MDNRHTNILKKARLSYRAACGEYHTDHKSLHWDVFDENFDRFFDNPEIWENIRNNRLASGMGGGGLAPPGTLQIMDAETVERLSSCFYALVEEEGLDFVLNAMEMEAGHPEFVECNDVRVGKQDILLVHNLRTFLPWYDAVHNATSSHNPIIIEIGGGYGGFAAKLKKARPKAKIIIFDLPESGAFQYLYLSKLFPEERILSLVDVSGDLSSFVRETDFDVLLLPGWEMDNLDDGVVDMAVSLRTFLELNLSIVEYYLRNLERTLRVDSVFYLVSRIEKRTTGEHNVLKKYPFDKRWFAVQSNAAFNQKQLHELVLLRSLHPNAYPLQEALECLPPFDWAEVMNAVRTAKYRFNILLWGNHPGVLGGLVPNAARRFLDRVPLLRALARSIRKWILK